MTITPHQLASFTPVSSVNAVCMCILCILGRPGLCSYKIEKTDVVFAVYLFLEIDNFKAFY